jgi:hypothetical protein
MWKILQYIHLHELFIVIMVKSYQRKAKRRVTYKNQKKERTLVPFMVRSYFTHIPFNVACMQIVKI